MFEFDPAKSAANLAKHGIDFEAAKQLWNDETSISIPAKEGEDGEARTMVIGQIEGKFWSAIVTFRGIIVRIISVRRSRNDEKELYDEQNH